MKGLKKALAYALAATLALGSCTSVFAATSPSTAPKPVTKPNVTATASKSVAKVATNKNGSAAIKTVKNEKSVTIPAKVKVGKVNYNVTTINAKAFAKAKKATKITINKPVKKITFKKNAFQGVGSKVKTVTIKITKASQIKAEKGAFKALKKNVVIKVDKKTSKAQLKKIKKALKDAGFKGTVKKA